ncbi:hypothetical protein [uncultured Paraglaciecola sp.]
MSKFVTYQTKDLVATISMKNGKINVISQQVIDEINQGLIKQNDRRQWSY